MDPRRRLRMLFQEDPQSRDVNTLLNRVPETEIVRTTRPPVPVIPGQGDSASAGPSSGESSLTSYPNTSSDENFAEVQNAPKAIWAASPPQIPCPTSFTPAIAMARYPFKYCSGELSHIVRKQFYNDNKFWNRAWDLYFLSVPKQIYRKALLLVPTVQAQAFLDEINSATNFRLSLTGAGRQGLILDFANDGSVWPQYIGQSNTPERKDQLVASLPESVEDWADWTHHVPNDVFWPYDAKIRKAVGTIKPDREAEKRARKAKRDAANLKLELCLGRVQAYFGLRPALQANTVQPSFANGKLNPIDVLRPVQFDFQDMPIFISLDTEWMESHNILTEIGISTLDTRKLQGVVPGDYGQMWISQIQSRHLRVTEHRSHVNSKYQQGCPDEFHHGKSEFVMSADIARVVDQAFSLPNLVLSGHEEKRKVILVGLGLKNDIDLLKAQRSQVFLGLDMWLPDPSSPFIDEVVDVAQLYKVYSGDSQPPGLSNMLKNLHIVALDLHNAGNDAFHTLEALVRLMLRAAGEKPDSYEWGAGMASGASALDSKLEPEH